VTLVSVVVPVFDESAVLDELHRRVSEALRDLDYELVLVDDGSRDDSWERMRALAAADRRVRLIRLSRNFGHQIAITAGLDAARGESVVVLDADLQDPPELIPDLVARWREGYDVVYAVRAERSGESAFKLVTARAFYRLLQRLAGIEIPADAGDFRLLSRRAADALGAMPERSRYLRGMTSWIGFRQSGVPYRREARFAGETKYPLRKMLRFATDAVLSFSTVPIRLVSSLGLVVVVFCVGYLAYTVYLALFTHQTVQGWASLIVIVLLLGGMQLISLGIIGQYVGRIFEEVKRRPLYLVSETVERDD
jgi:glycosyltransferase involved in cell wall biosynthesis